MSASSFSTTPLLSLQRVGWIGIGDSRLMLVDALGGFYSLREQIAQDLGAEVEAEIVQRAGFASAERLIAAGRDSGQITTDEPGFRYAVSLLSSAGYGRITVTELRLDERWARITVDWSVEGWMFRESGTRQTPSCDYLRGLLAGVMHYLAEDIPTDALSIPTDDDIPALDDISCVELTCIGTGEENCQFAVGPASLLAVEGLTPNSTAQNSVRETLLRLNRQLEQILDSSRKDSLTKLYNRSFFESSLRQKIGYAKRRSDVVSLAVVDIDYFKTINDTQGHTVGDRVLRQIARSLDMQARDNDIVARLGGDEFVWLMPATSGESALSVVQRLRRTLEEIAPQIGFQVTASIGVANYPQDASTSAELYERADAALFAAKRAGRDQAVRYSPAVAASDVFANNFRAVPAPGAPNPPESTDHRRPSAKAQGQEHTVTRTVAAQEDLVPAPNGEVQNTINRTKVTDEAHRSSKRLRYSKKVRF